MRAFTAASSICCFFAKSQSGTINAATYGRPSPTLTERGRAPPSGRLGQAPAVQDGHAERPEELLDLTGQPGPAADEEAQAPAGQPLPQGAEHQALGQATLRAEDRIGTGRA